MKLNAGPTRFVPSFNQNQQEKSSVVQEDRKFLPSSSYKITNTNRDKTIFREKIDEVFQKYQTMNETYVILKI